jgi:hypothetical protein
MKLWIINITLEEIQQPVQLMFNDAERARAAAKLLRGDSSVRSPGLHEAPVIDDYGRELAFNLNRVMTVLLTDVAQELSGRSEYMLLEAHAQADHARRMHSDEKLRRASAMIQPVNSAGQMPPFAFPPRN